MSNKSLSFIEIKDRLFNFWCSKGSVQLFGFDYPVGAGTWHPEVVRCSLLEEKYNICFTQPSRREQDAGGGNNRIYKHHQFQILVAPIPHNMQKLVLQSLEACGLDTSLNNIDFEPGDWSSPSMGAFGKGYEITCNGAEIAQYTYFQQMLDKKLKIPPVEVAYGLERLALVIQNKLCINDLVWCDIGDRKILWGDICKKFEEQSQKASKPEALFSLITQYETICYSSCNFYTSYEAFVSMSHSFNLLEATGINYVERELLIERVRNAGRFCATHIDTEIIAKNNKLIYGESLI